MKLYVAGWNASDARELADLLEAHGHRITSSWHGGWGNPTVLRRTVSMTLEERHVDAVADYVDIAAADGLVQMTGAVLKPTEELYDPRRDVRRFEPSDAEIKRVLGELNRIRKEQDAAHRELGAAVRHLDSLIGPRRTKKNLRLRAEAEELLAVAEETLTAAMRRRPAPPRESAWVEGDHWWPTPECYTIGIPFLAKGCFVEFGYARALGKRLLVLGLPEGLFHWERRVARCYSFRDLDMTLRALERPAAAYKLAYKEAKRRADAEA